MNTVQLGGRNNADAQRESTTRESQIFNGDGATLLFTLTDTEGVPDFVEVGGLPQRPGIDYTITSNSITFAVGNAPANLANNVVIYYFTKLNLTADPLARVNVSTADALITLNMGSKKQRNFLGSAEIAANKTISVTNVANAIKFVFAFSLDAARVLSLPSDFKSNDGGWNNATQQWTAAAGGNYVLEATMVGNYWQAVFHGPNT